MTRLRQQLVRRVRLLLTVWLLALAWAPTNGAAADIPLHARVVQIATSRSSGTTAIAEQPRAPSAPAPCARETQHVAITAEPRAATSAARAAHGPSFDGRALYLDLCSILC